VAGIGAATALAFAAEGARLLLAARRPGKLAEVASRHWRAAHRPFIPSLSMCATARRPERYRRPVAGVGGDRRTGEQRGLSRGLDKLYMGRIEDWEEMIDTNVKGLLYLSRAVVPGMVTRGRGHVVNLVPRPASSPTPMEPSTAPPRPPSAPSTTACARIYWEPRCA